MTRCRPGLLRPSIAQTALQHQDERTRTLADVVSEPATMEEPRKRLAGIVSSLDIHYDLGGDTRCSAAACRTSTS